MEDRKSRTLYIIRHGETDPNKNHIIQGSGLDAPLNDTGRRQAKDFFSAYRHISFGKIYTSNLIRTWQSVQPFLDLGIPHVSLNDLREISWGVKDGTKINPSEQLEYQGMLNDWKAGLLDRCFPRGESPNQVLKRMDKAMIEVMSDSQQDTLLMCIHGRALRILLSYLLNTPLQDMEQYQHSNLCLYILVWDGKFWKMTVQNDVSHLR
jgi:probable phosphoglycerate mutase